MCGGGNDSVCFGPWEGEKTSPAPFARLHHPGPLAPSPHPPPLFVDSKQINKIMSQTAKCGKWKDHAGNKLCRDPYVSRSA